MRIDRDAAVIVCAGPSLDTMSWDEVRNAGAIVAVNGAAASEAAARHGIRFTHIAAMDLALGLADRVPRLREIWNTTGAFRLTSIDTPHVPAEAYVCEVDEADGVDGWADDVDSGYKGGSTAMVAGNWLGNHGWRKLVYVGLDMHPGDGRHAAGCGTHASGFSDTIEHWERVCAAWQRLVAQAAERGIEVVNVTPGTAMVFGVRSPRTPSLAFVACVECGELEEKTMRLVRSIRANGGRFANAPVYTFQPRIGTTITRETKSILDDLGVTHSTEPLNTDFAHYAIGNKIVASARAEEIARDDILVFVDSDTIITSEPSAFELPDGIDAAVRPVDIHRNANEPAADDDPFWRTHHRRVSSSGPGDPMDDYWTRMYALLGITTEPYVVTTCSRQRIRAYFNSGLIVVRRRARLFAQWHDDFLRLVAARHIPPFLGASGSSIPRSADAPRNAQAPEELRNAEDPEEPTVPRGTDWHYLDQLSLAATLTRVWDRVTILDGRYNYPFPGRAELLEPFRSMPLEQLVHVHYNSSFHELLLECGGAAAAFA